MNHRITPRRIDLFEAVKYDIRLHGFRLIAAEFALAGLGGLAVTIVEFLHASHGGAPLLGGLWFLSVAINCVAVVFLAIRVRRTGTSTQFSDRRLHLYVLELVVMLLIPLAVALVALQQWHAHDFHTGPAVPSTKETS